ncbi:hypothetical protein PACTADRAFT_3380 [Pachysolen tannophilus NRRL Y-2460]|uniref:Trafficking protein particle complex subunit n=1 Tax=Pachysolen tannophilus NRRL Y-2460 TaxID=669874 RepID=A0A1E4TV97_PACTA|nr:hypothetical protein PACTADRAFT_3380 [Pachysolen tannophilus NRRL Y-2460]
MAVYSFWIFDRHCNCIYSREWVAITQDKPDHQQEQTQKNITNTGTINARNQDHVAKLLFGAIFSLKQISSKLNPQEETTANNLKSFSTLKYRCHFFETGTGLKFCLLTDPKTENMQFVLKEIYAKLYYEKIVKNVLSPVDFKENEYIDNEVFITGVDNYISSLAVFNN